MAYFIYWTVVWLVSGLTFVWATNKLCSILVIPPVIDNTPKTAGVPTPTRKPCKKCLERRAQKIDGRS